MSTWYELRSYSLEIVPVEVEKETNQKILIAAKGQWRARWAFKRASYSLYYPSLAEARKALRERLNAIINNAREELRKSEAALRELDFSERAVEVEP